MEDDDIEKRRAELLKVIETGTSDEIMEAERELRELDRADSARKQT